MTKKFGKLLLFSVAIGSAAGALCYYARKKNGGEQENSEEEDYDDFSDDTPKDSDTSHGYVPLTPEPPVQEAAETPIEDTSAGEASGEAGSFTPLTENNIQSAENAEETVEEFFDEDSSDKEPSA